MVRKEPLRNEFACNFTARNLFFVRWETSLMETPNPLERERKLFCVCVEGKASKLNRLNLFFNPQSQEREKGFADEFD